MNNWELASMICNGEVQKLEKDTYHSNGNIFYDILGSMVVDLDSTEISLVGMMLHSVWKIGRQARQQDRISRLKEAIHTLDILIDKCEREFIVEINKEGKEGKEAVEHPSHYNRGNMECIDALPHILDGLDGMGGFYIGNFIKYIWRWKGKNGLEDLNKAKWYISRYNEELSRWEM